MNTFIILLFFLSEAASDQRNLIARPGENATLECDAGKASITVVEWTREDLEPMYVLYYSDGLSYQIDQHPSFKDRVGLVDSKMENGDVSLYLKNVSIKDSGTYRCRVITAGPSRTNRAINREPIRTIHLEVKDSQSGDSKTDNPENGNFTRVYVGLGAGFVLLCIAVIVIGLFRGRKNKRYLFKVSEGFDAVEAVVHQLI